MRATRSRIGLLAAIISMSSLGALSTEAAQAARAAGIQFNHLDRSWVATGNPTDRSSWSQKVKAKRQSARNERQRRKKR